MFDTTKTDLSQLLSNAQTGCLQLPDFQRDYVWGDEDVRSLIASVAKGFPIGALLVLENGGEVKFKPRLLAGVPTQEKEAKELLLDGQQRITSLYQSTFSDEAVCTRTNNGKEVSRYYYLDLNRALVDDANIEEAILGFPADRVLRKNFGREIQLDLSSSNKEYMNDMFPLNQVFQWNDWYFEWKSYWRENGRGVDNHDPVFKAGGVIDNINKYEVPIIKLKRENRREAICLIFEKVNVGGKKLDAFELLTAIFAADEFDLRKDWYGGDGAEGRRRRIIGYPNPRDVLTKVASTDFLQACTLLHTRKLRLDKYNEGLRGRNLPQVSCNRDALLSLPLSGYREHAESVTHGIIEASKFLNEQKIIWQKDIPYPPLLIGLASVFAILGRDASTTAAKEKIADWFWSVTLGELFGASTETRLARDIPELVSWISHNGPRPRAIDEAFFQEERFRTLRTRVSAAYKGIHALVMRRGCRDFLTGNSIDIMTFFNEQIDIHHIFPVRWCQSNDIPAATYNSIVNKTPLSRATNQSIGGDAPSNYLLRIEKTSKVQSATLDEILKSHLINPDHLRKDDFEAFFDSRIAALSELVSKAMGKSVVSESGTNEEERDVEVSIDEEQE